MNDLPPPPTETIDLKSVLAVLRRQRRVVAYSATIVFACATLFMALTQERFTATALLLIDPSGKSVMAQAQTVARSGSVEHARIDSEVEVLRSDAIALGVIDRLALGEDPQFQSSPSLLGRLNNWISPANATTPGAGGQSTAKTLERFHDVTRIKRRGLTYVVEVAAVSPSPEQARDLANSVAETYIDAQVAGRIANNLAGRDILMGEIDRARERVAAFEQQTAAFVDQKMTNLANIEGTANVMVQQLQAQRAQLKDQHQLITDSQQQLADQEWAALADMLGDEHLSKLTRDREALSRHSSLKDELAALDEMLNGLARARLSDMKAGAAELQASTAALEAELRQRPPMGAFSPDELTSLYALRQEAEIAREQYQNLLSRMRELEAQAAIQMADSRIVSAAILPTNPTFPNPRLVALLAIAAALGLGLGMAFLNEYFIGGITSESQLTEIARLPVAAAVPALAEAGKAGTSPADRIIDAPLGAYAEAHRKLRAAVDLGLRRTGQGAGTGKVIMITSALAGEGKTTLALGLARTYAQSGRKTLLIDADLRKPSLHTHLDHLPSAGFADYLRDSGKEAALQDFYARDPASSLAMILGAARSQTATDQLLTSETFTKILDQAREVYEMTIIDTPPLLPVVDARYIAPYVDAAVLAAKWGSTNQGDVRASAEALRLALPNTALVVSCLTRAQNTRGAEAGYSGYGEDYSAAI